MKLFVFVFSLWFFVPVLAFDKNAGCGHCASPGHADSAFCLSARCNDDAAAGDTANNARVTAERKCTEAAKQASDQGQTPQQAQNDPNDAPQVLTDDQGRKFYCKCPGIDEPRPVSDQLNCDPNDQSQEEEEEEGGGENPFQCAGGGGGGGGQQSQIVQQQLQQRAQMENQCAQQYEQARVACDPESVVGFRGMLDEAMAKAERAQNAEEKGLKQACDEYKKAFEKASSELKSFRQSCSNAKAQCLGTCNQAIVENRGTSPVMAMLAACLPMLGPMADMMAAKNISIKNVEIKDCQSFEQILADADAKQQELVDSMRTADKCQSEIEESCKTNPDQEQCRKIETATRDSGELRTVDTQLERKQSPIDFNARGAGGAAIAPVEGGVDSASVRTPSGGTSANLGGGGGGGGGPRGARGNRRGGYGSQYDDIYNRTKEGGFQKARRGGGSGGYASPKYNSPRRVVKKKGKDNGKYKTGIDLKKYMHGGAGNGLVDGITPASGPGIFEKVSNRYKLKKGSLLRH